MEWIKATYLVIEYLAVAIIAGMAGYSTARHFIFLVAKRDTPDENYRKYKHTLGKGLLLGLEILVAEDVILYRNDQPNDDPLPRFDHYDWLAYRPIRLPETVIVRQRLPAGAAAVLINQAHENPDLILPVDASELRLVEAINGDRTIEGILHHISLTDTNSLHQFRKQARSLFERLWWYDQVVFDITRKGDE